MLKPDWEALFQALPGPYLVLLPDDPIYTILTVNAAYAQATHTQPDVIIGRGVFEIFPDNPADPDATGVRNLHASLRRVIAAKAPDSMPIQKYDIRVYGPDGWHFEERHWSPLNSPMLDADGNITCILHRAEDVTDFVRLQRREAEQGRLTHELQLRSDRMEAELFLRSHELAQARQMSRERLLLSLFAEHSPEFIGIADLQGSAEYFNPAAMTLVGARDLEDVRRRHATDFVISEQRTFVADVVIPTVYDHGRWQGELNFQHLVTGEVIPVYCDFFRVDDPATGQPTHLATVTRDLRERKEAERRNAFLVQLDDAIRSLTDPHQLVQTVTSMLGGYLKVHGCGYAALEADQDTFALDGDYHVGAGPRIEQHRLSQFSAMIRDRLCDGRTAVVEDAERDAHAATSLPFYRLAGIRSLIFAPVQATGRRAALLMVHQSTPREWRREEVEVVQLVASRCWEAVERLRVTRQIQADRARQALMLELLEGQRKMVDPLQMMLASARAVGEFLKVDRTGFFEMQGDELHFVAGWTAGRLPLLDSAFPAEGIGLGYLAEVRAGRTLGISDVHASPLTSDSRFPEIGVVSFIGVPIIRNGRWHAGFYVNCAEVREWTTEEIALAQAAGEQTWDAVERARAGIALRRSEERLNFALEAGGGVGTWDWDTGSGLVRCDSRLASLLALDPAQMFEGTPLSDFMAGIHPEDRARVEAGLLQADGKGPDYIDEYRVVSHAGPVRWIYARGRRHDEPGVPARFSGVAFDVTERKQAEAGVRQQWHTFDTALSNTPDATYVFDLDGRFVYGNRALLSRLGRPYEQVVGRGFGELDYPVELADRVNQQIRQVISTREAVRDQTPLSSADGELRHYEYIFVPVLGADGRVEAVAGSTRDITERSRTEELVQADRRRWQDLLLQTPAAIAVLRDPEHRFEWINPGYSRLIGRAGEDVLDKTMAEVFPEFAGQGHIEALDNVYRSGMPFEGREALVSMRRGDGTIHDKFLNFVYLATRNVSGAIDGIFVHATDVTDAVLARQRIEENERQFRTLADTIPHLAWMADADGYIFWYNRRWYEYTGTTLSDVEGAKWKSVHDPETLPAVLERWNRSLATGEPFEMVFPLRGADGSFRSFLTRGEPVRDSSGRLVRWFGTNTDITEQQRTEAELRRMNRELEEFAYVASHDLQEPLRMVNSFTQLLLRRHINPDSGEAQEFAGFIRQGVQRMEQLISGLLTYSRALEGGELLPTPEHSSADLNVSWAEARSILEGRIVEEGAEVTAGALPTVRGETAQLAHVFQNLLSNALKYRKESVRPVITVDAEMQAGMWVIAVRDNGIGFEQKYAEGIFGLFKRLYRDEYPGTGLGLAICQRIVERYGGRVWAESQPDAGASFFVALRPGESETPTEQ